MDSLSLACRLGLTVPSQQAIQVDQPVNPLPRVPQAGPKTTRKAFKKDVKGGKSSQLDFRLRTTGPTLVSVKGAAHREHAAKLKRIPYAKSAPNTPNVIDVLRQLLQDRYNPVTKSLDLSRLAASKILKAGGIVPPGEKGAPTKTAPVLWRLCEEHYPDVRSLSLADNNLPSLRPMALDMLVKTFPKLERISVAGNRLSSFSALDSFSVVVHGTNPSVASKNQGLYQLRDLNLRGNPLRTIAEKDPGNGLRDYLLEACRRFPALIVLDGEDIDPVMKSQVPILTEGPSTLQDGLPAQPPLPLRIKPPLFDGDSTATIISLFCQKFFTSHDQDRSLLLDAYSSEASFSLSAAPDLPARAKRAGLTRNSKEMPAQRGQAWHEYINLSRNIARLKGPKLDDRISYGPTDIIKHLNTLPRMKHVINEPGKVILDGWQMPLTRGDTDESAIYAIIHGEFQEFPNLSFRSFDRTFVLVPAPPASAAALHGWPCVILTDQLTVRSYSSPKAWVPEPEPSIDEQKQKMLQRFMEATELKQEIALECLVHNGWEPQRALENFQTIKVAGGLPPDAFVAASAL